MRYKLIILLFLCFASCSGPEPRRPKETKNLHSINATVERGKALLAHEQKIIQEIIKKDSLHLYEHSASGSWYYYQSVNDTASYFPKPDDLVTMTYNLMSFENDTIYSQEEIGIVIYKVDKQELFPGLRNSVKLLKENETATFLYPSSMAYGYLGDKNRIGVNVPLKSTLTILKIQKQKDIPRN